MGTSESYIGFVCEKLERFGNIRSRKMFGEYMVYLNDKPILTVCDNTVFVKKLPQLSDIMKNSDCGFPYDGAKEMLLVEDVDDKALLTGLFRAMVEELSPPKRK